MALAPGSSVGHYRILGVLGAGGMGEVYRAHDRKLGRDVALKVLPDAVSADAERRARFAREARALAALNHPNIAQIHGFEDDASTSALIMELVEGRDLSERIRRGPLPFDDAIAIARQIGDALQAAHDRGIIHRDLKPANIKLRDDGTVKVLDFGLAKALDQGSEIGDQGSASLSNSPTITSPMTLQGVILGTAAYMAPEQAKGRVVDKRADIWAFGCVLYEMLTGRRAFAGDDVSDTLAAILKSDVDWSGVPPRAIRLLTRCLEKDPRKRLHDIGDAWDLLEDARHASAAGAPVRSSRLAWSLAVLFALSTIALVLMRFLTVPPAPPAMARFQLAAPTGNEFGTYVSLSPDGRRLAFTAADSERNVALWVRDLDSLEARRLPGTQNATSPFWSPDGKFIAFADGRTLNKIDVGGGPPQKIAEAPTPFGVGAWSRDGVIVVGTRGIGPLYRVAAGGGTPVALTAIDETKERGHSFPLILPDQKQFLYVKLTGFRETEGIYLGSIDAAPAQQDTQRLLPLAVGPLALVTSAAGSRLLFVRDSTLVSQPIDVDRVQLSGDAQPVAERIAIGGSFAFFGAAGDVLVYRTGGAENITNEQLTWYSRTGKVLGTIGESLAITGGPSSVALAPDARRAALMVTSARFTPDLWIVEFARGLVSRLTFTDDAEIAPVWAPDSRRLAYRARPVANQPFSMMVKDVDGTSEAQPPAGRPVSGLPNGWSSDGRFMLFTRGPDGNTLDLLALSINGKTETMLLQTPFNEGSARLSPDNRWMAYQSNESGQTEIYVRRFLIAGDGTPSLGPKSRVSSNGGMAPHWRGDGREMIYRSISGDFMAVDVRTSGETIDISLPRRLFPNVAGVHAWDVTADAQRLLLSVPVGATTAVPVDPMTVILNWSGQ